MALSLSLGLCVDLYSQTGGSKGPLVVRAHNPFGFPGSTSFQVQRCNAIVHEVDVECLGQARALALGLTPRGKGIAFLRGMEAASSDTVPGVTRRSAKRPKISGIPPTPGGHKGNLGGHGFQDDIGHCLGAGGDDNASGGAERLASRLGPEEFHAVLHAELAHHGLIARAVLAFAGQCWRLPSCRMRSRVRASHE